MCIDLIHLISQDEFWMKGSDLRGHLWNDESQEVSIVLSFFFHSCYPLLSIVIIHFLLYRFWAPYGQVDFLWLAIHLSQNMRKHLRNAKNKKFIARYFASFFTVHSISHQGWHLREKSKDFLTLQWPYHCPIDRVIFLKSGFGPSPPVTIPRPHRPSFFHFFFKHIFDPKR